MPELRLDHVVIGVEDLEEAATELTRVLGRAPSWRGRHPTYGTANVLYRLDNAYLELLAPDATNDARSAWAGSLGHFLNDRGAGLFAIALATDDAAATAAAVRTRGLAVDDPLPGEGVDLDTGAVRRWANARIPPELSRGTRAFFIEHRSPPDALPPAGLGGKAPACARCVVALVIESSDVEGARKLWRDAFALPEQAEGESWRYDLGNTAVALQAGAGDAAGTDRWLRRVLGVPSITALADRLDAQGLDFEQGDFTEGWGIRARPCGAEVVFLETA